MSENNKKNGFLMQAGILAAASIICRIIGLLYRSPLTAIIGEEGNGYYSFAINIYTIVLLISSYSIPSAISKVIAQKLAIKEYRNAQRLFHCAIIYVIVVGGVGSLVAFFGAPLFVMGNSIPVLRVFAPTIFVYGLLGVLRGYFQAHKTMLQTSISQILEQILNAVVSMGAAYLLIQMVIDKDESTRAMYGAMGSALGTGAGVLIALIFMWAIYMMNRKTIRRRVEHDKTPIEDSYGEVFKTIMLVVTPFILSTFIYNIPTSLNQTLYMKVMVTGKGMGEVAISGIYGAFSLMVGISNIPIALSSAMSSAIVPTVATTYAQGKVKQTKNKIAAAIKVTMLISIPAAVGIGALAWGVVYVLYPSYGDMAEAPKMLMGLAITIIFYALSTLTNAVLQGIGKVNTPVIHAAVSLVIQTAIVFPLLKFTDFGINALVIAMVAYSFMMCILNAAAIKKALNYKQEMDKTFIRPLFCAAIMGAVAWGIYEGISYLFKLWLEGVYLINLISLIFAVGIAIILYFILIIKLKAVNEEELKGLPKGAAILRMAKKMRLL